MRIVPGSPGLKNSVLCSKVMDLYQRRICIFSALRVPLQKALPFETIAAPWPAAGHLWDTLVVAERVFRKTLGAQLGFSYLAPGSVSEWPWSKDEENEQVLFNDLLLPWMNLKRHLMETRKL